MKEITLEIGQLFDFLAEKYGLEYPLEEIVPTPFEFYLPSEDPDTWHTCSGLIKKEAALYKVTMENGLEFKGADRHPLVTDYRPEATCMVFLEDLKPGEPIPYLNTRVKSVEKISDKESVYGVQVESRLHLYKTADGLLHHNSYEVTQAVKAGLAKRKNKLELIENSGSIGRSLSNLLAYFYPKRDGKFILLDDADDFLTSTDQLIKNFFKAMMDPDGHAISTPAGYRKLADKLIAAEVKDSIQEGTSIEINKDALREGYIDILVNGQQIGDGALHLQEAAKLSRLMRLREANPVRPKWLFDNYGRKRLSENEDSGEPDDEELDDDLFAIAHGDDDDEDSGPATLSDDPIPAKFMFNSCICIISNLYMDQVEEAIKSRTDKFEITLNNDEFMCRLGSILPKLKKGHGSDLSDSEWDWVKQECFAMLALAVEADKLGAPLAGTPFSITIGLQFRIIAELGDLFITVADRYAAGTGETNKTKIANAIRTKFIKYHLIPALAGQRVRKGRK